MTAISYAENGNIAQWGPLAASVNGDPLRINRRSLVLSAVQVTGTFGGTVSLQGSLDGIDWFVLRDTRGNLCDFTAASLVELSSAVRYVRPVTGVGVVAATVKIALGGP